MKNEQKFLIQFCRFESVLKISFKILGNPDVITYKKNSYKKKRVFDFSGFQ